MGHTELADISRPTAISTKRQVTRHRQVVDIPKVDRRDPRFSSLSGGPVDAHIHARGYAFMPDLLKTELKNLRASVAAAGKAERACKLSDKPRYTAERERLEKEMARVRTRLEKNEREAREREVLAKAKGEEREKRASGKGAWYMKKCEFDSGQERFCARLETVLTSPQPRRRTCSSRPASPPSRRRVASMPSRRLSTRSSRRSRARRRRAGRLSVVVVHQEVVVAMEATSVVGFRWSRFALHVRDESYAFVHLLRVVRVEEDPLQRDVYLCTDMRTT